MAIFIHYTVLYIQLSVYAVYVAYAVQPTFVNETYIYDYLNAFVGKNRHINFEFVKADVENKNK